LIRRIALILSCIALAFAALTLTAGVAGAQSEPDIADYTSEDGTVDFDGYVAALNAFLAASGGAGGGALPATGSDNGDLVAIGAGMVLLGGSAVLWARDRRQRMVDG
jgi:LPXTG-motif cell wall-anchored protein